MYKIPRIYLFIILSFLLISAFPLSAQYIVEQLEFEVPAGYDLTPDDFDPASFEESAMFFLEIPDEKLKASAQEAGEEVDIQKTTIYIDGENYAVEMTSPMGKVSVISDSKSQKMYYIMWSKKKVMEMSAGDMKQMEQSAMNMAEEALKNLPPEYREKYQAEMQAQKNKPAVAYKAKPTGKKATKYGMACEQYLITKEEEEEVIAIWASKDNSGLAKIVDKTREQLEKIFSSQDEGADFDEWQAVPGKIPVEVRTYRPGMAGTPMISVSAITRIEKKTPPPDKFYVPTQKEGFTHGTMQDMMKDMMPEGSDEY